MSLLFIYNSRPLFFPIILFLWYTIVFSCFFTSSWVLSLLCHKIRPLCAPEAEENRELQNKQEETAHFSHLSPIRSYSLRVHFANTYSNVHVHHACIDEEVGITRICTMRWEPISVSAHKWMEITCELCHQSGSNTSAREQHFVRPPHKGELAVQQPDALWPCLLALSRHRYTCSALHVCKHTWNLVSQLIFRLPALCMMQWECLRAEK